VCERVDFIVSVSDNQALVRVASALHSHAWCLINSTRKSSIGYIAQEKAGFGIREDLSLEAIFGNRIWSDALWYRTLATESL